MKDERAASSWPISNQALGIDASSPSSRSGCGELAFFASNGRTFIRTARAHSPLHFLMPRNHGHGAWVFMANFGGGLLDGDAVVLEVDVGPGSCALIGTQASTKVYRSPTIGSRQEIKATVGVNGSLVFLPDPTSCFAGARYRQSTTVELSAGASLVLVDTVTAGRSARGERWDFNHFSSRLRVVREGRLVVVDSVLLDPAHGDLRRRMGRFDAFSTIVVLGPIARVFEASFQNAVPHVRERASVVEAVSPLRDSEGAIVRLAGTQVEGVLSAVHERLRDLASVLGDDPWARKW